MNTRTISLDIDKRHAIREPITIAQGDRNGTTIAATIYDGGTLVTTSGLSARFRMRLPDGRHFYEKTATWDAASGTATVTIDETQAASAPGTTTEAYFELLSGTTVIHSTSRFSVRVLRSATEGFDPATSYSDRVEELLDGLDELPLPANSAPVMDGTASVGTSGRYARQDHVHPTDTSRASTAVATTSANGLMSATDKAKLNGIAANANAYTLPPATASSLGGVKPDGTTITVDSDGTIHGASTYELPTMSASTKGGAKLGDGLALTDGALGIDPEPQESTGEVRGAISSLTAKGWATQTQTTGKNLASEFENGGINWSTGNSSSSSTRIRTKGYIDVTEGTTYTLSIQSGYKVAIRLYDSNGTDKGSEGSEAYKPTLPYTFTIPSGVAKLRLLVAYSNDADITADDMGWVQLEVGSTATDYEPYSGGAPSPSPDWPQEIQVALGRNLISRTLSDLKSFNTGGTWNGNVYSYGGVTYTVNDDGSVTLSGMRTSGQPSNFRLAHTNNTLVLDAGTYTLSGCPGGGSDSTYRLDMYSGGSVLAIDHGDGKSFTISETKEFERVLILPYAGVNVTGLTFYPQLELGSIPTPYVPYGHVVIDITHDGTTTTIPVPLPSKGFAASLPDGTADVLTIDGAGKVEWASAVARIESYAGESVGAVYLSTTGSLTTGAGVYYPATPVTEDFGYIDWPSIPDGAVITCPELDALGVRYLIGNGVSEMARDWYERAKSEYESRISALEQAVAELATT